MKKVVILISFTLLICSFTTAQRNEKRDSKEKIAALEKIKLIESLNMDEDTVVKFFARRNEHQEKMKELLSELDEKRNKIKDKISSAKDDNDPEFKKLIENYFSAQQKLEEERQTFFNTLTDILTYRQMAELTLFERRFREEIRDVLIHHKKRKRD